MKLKIGTRMTTSVITAVFVTLPMIASAGSGCGGMGPGKTAYHHALNKGQFMPSQAMSKAYHANMNNYAVAVNNQAGFYKAAHHAGDGAMKKTGDIVDTAVGAGSFKTLVTAIEAAGLVETLKGAGPFTVFAPTDEAFAKIPKDQLDALIADKDALTKVLTYHVVPGSVTAGEVVNLKEAKTVQGSSVKIDATDGVKVDNANVVKTDIRASNGIIHVIDTVIMPN